MTNKTMANLRFTTERATASSIVRTFPSATLRSMFQTAFCTAGTRVNGFAAALRTATNIRDQLACPSG